MNIDALGLSKDEILSMVVDKIVSQIWNDDRDIVGNIEAVLHAKIEEAVTGAIGKGLTDKIDSVLNAEMEKILHETVTPRNIWGEKQGEPTTIRAALSERAREFWNIKIDERSGKESTYGGRPRHEYLMKQLLTEEFNSAIKGNATTIVAAFKDAVKADASRLLSEHIDKLIPIKTH